MLSLSRWLTTAVTICALLLAESAARFVSTRRVVGEALIDLQSPGSLVVKLEYLKAFQGYKVVLLGDSLVFGSALGDFGDKQWRSHTLGPRLAERLQALNPARPTLVMNLGINGALPADLEVLTKEVVACNIDFLILDTQLRHFSLDFASPDSQFARPWLKNWEATGLASGLNSRENLSCWERAERACGEGLTRNSHIWRLRDFFQQELSSKLSAWHGGVSNQALPSNDPMLNLLRLQERLKTVTLQPTNPQCQALERTLGFLCERKQRTVVFYAKENASLARLILSESAHKRLCTDLNDILSKACSPPLTYLPPCPALETHHFLDYCHLNEEGFRLLANYLITAMVQ